MKKIAITLILMSVTLPSMFGQIAAVFDEQTFVQRALNFFREFSETVEQGLDQAEELALEYEKADMRYKKIAADVKDYAENAKQAIVLYKELDYCLQDLEALRKNLIQSNYLSVQEKYSLYSLGQNVCYDIVKRKSTIKEIVDESQKYQSNQENKKKPEDFKEKLQSIIDEIRFVRYELSKINDMAVQIIEFKQKNLRVHMQLQRTFSLKLY